MNVDAGASAGAGCGAGEVAGGGAIVIVVGAEAGAGTGAAARRRIASSCLGRPRRWNQWFLRLVPDYIAGIYHHLRHGVHHLVAVVASIITKIKEAWWRPGQSSAAKERCGMPSGRMTS